MTQDRIIERVQKLLALAGNNPSEAERDAAMAKVHAILAEHNLSMTEVNAAKKDDNKVGMLKTVYRDAGFIKLIFSNIARLYFCKPVMVALPRRKRQYLFIGTAENSAVASQVFVWLCDAIWKEGGRQQRAGGYRNDFFTSFCNSAAWRVGDRINEMIREAKAGELKAFDGKTNLPALIDTYEQTQEANQAFSDEQFGELRKTSSRTGFSNFDGMRAGTDYGDRVHIGPTLGKGGTVSGRLK